jgi:hypothetical protein
MLPDDDKLITPDWLENLCSKCLELKERVHVASDTKYSNYPYGPIFNKTLILTIFSGQRYNTDKVVVHMELHRQYTYFGSAELYFNKTRGQFRALLKSAGITTKEPETCSS